MTAFLFLQKFSDGVATPMPFDDVADVMVAAGPLRRDGVQHAIDLDPDRYASHCILIGNERTGVECIGFERPIYSEELRQLVWKCMRHLGCTVFDDALERAYDTVSCLPEPIRQACPLECRHISSAQQLWPEGLSFLQPGATRPALRYRRPGDTETRIQLFDHIGNSEDELYCEVALHPAACTAGSAAVIGEWMRRINEAVSAGQQTVMYRFRQNETKHRLFEMQALPQPKSNMVLVSSGEQAFLGDGQPAAPDFIADRDVFAGSLSQALQLSATMQARGFVFNGSALSIAELDRLLDEEHLRDAAQRRQATDGSALINREVQTLAVLAGCYLGVLLCRHIGGQWGYITHGYERLPVVRSHRGSLWQPHLQVLDHLVNGRQASVGVWFSRLEESDVSATGRDEDLVCNIPGFCDILLGQSQFSGNAGLPMESAIPRNHLDFSIESLQHLDRYLGDLALRIGQFSGESLSNIELAAGAYLGEVIRSNCRNKSAWLWVNYADFSRSNPGFSDRRPWHRCFRAFLDSAESTIYPIAQICVRLTEPEAGSLADYAREVLGNDEDLAQHSNTSTDAAAAKGPEAADITAWPADAPMAAILDGIREKLGIWRRLATPTDYSGLRCVGPAWLSAHPLQTTVANQKFLLEKGEVVWGAMLQANTLLFAPGPDDHPAAIIFSRDPHFASRPGALSAIAGHLISFKKDSEQAPEDCRAIADWLANETSTEHHPIPTRISTQPVAAASMMVFRKHLPPSEFRLTSSLFPLLVHEATDAVIVAPCKFWPLDLINAWRQSP